MTSVTVDALIRAMADRVAELVPGVPIYASPTQQGASLPAVFLSVMGAKTGGQIGRDKRTIGLDIVYMEKSNCPDINRRFHKVAEVLDAGIDVIPYSDGLPLRTYDRKWYIDEDTLHYQFKIKVLVTRPRSGEAMGTIEALREEVRDGKRTQLPH